MNEFSARLPFALSSLFSLLALYALGVRMFSNRAGRWIGATGALLLAVNGFAVGLSRIAQYQGSMT